METGVGDTQFLIDLKSFKIGFKLKPIWKKMLIWINFLVSPCFSWKPKTDVATLTWSRCYNLSAQTRPFYTPENWAWNYFENFYYFVCYLTQRDSLWSD